MLKKIVYIFIIQCLFLGNAAFSCLDDVIICYIKDTTVPVGSLSNGQTTGYCQMKGSALCYPCNFQSEEEGNQKCRDTFKECERQGCYIPTEIS